MEGIIVEEIEGLQAAAGATAMALIWEGRIIIDSKLREKPYLRHRMLQHEFKHFKIVQKHGMTKKAGRWNALLDLSYGYCYGLNFRIGAALDKVRDRKASNTRREIE